MPAFWGAKRGDKIFLKVGNWFDLGRVNILHVFENKSRTIEEINQPIRDL